MKEPTLVPGWWRNMELPRVCFALGFPIVECRGREGVEVPLFTADLRPDMVNCASSSMTPGVSEAARALEMRKRGRLERDACRDSAYM